MSLYMDISNRQFFIIKIKQILSNLLQLFFRLLQIYLIYIYFICQYFVNILLFLFLSEKAKKPLE